jgi:spoIIIJ-associated protein
MEWVETTGRTVEEAKDRALDQLGVDEHDAEFEILEEPRPGLFGRVRGEARVRARVRPARPRPKVERRDRRRKPREAGAPERDATEVATMVDEAGPAPADELSPEPVPALAATAARDAGAKANGDGAAGARFLEGLAQAFGLQATATVVSVADDEVEVQLSGDELGILIGPRGQTLLAVQDLTRLAVHHQEGERTGRLRIDIAGYRQRRREALTRFVEQVAAEVKQTGVARALEPMAAADRKVVHDTVNGIAGLTTTSEGEDPRRRVVIRPAADG